MIDLAKIQEIDGLINKMKKRVEFFKTFIKGDYNNIDDGHRILDSFWSEMDSVESVISEVFAIDPLQIREGNLSQLKASAIEHYIAHRPEYCIDLIDCRIECIESYLNEIILVFSEEISLFLNGLPQQDAKDFLINAIHQNNKKSISSEINAESPKTYEGIGKILNNEQEHLNMQSSYKPSQEPMTERGKIKGIDVYINKSTYDKIDDALNYYDLISGTTICEETSYEGADVYFESFRLMSDIDTLKKENPQNYKKYFNRFLDRLNRSFESVNCKIDKQPYEEARIAPRSPTCYIFGVDIYSHEEAPFGDPENIDIDKLLVQHVAGCISDVINHLNGLLNSENLNTNQEGKTHYEKVAILPVPEPDKQVDFTNIISKIKFDRNGATRQKVKEILNQLSDSVLFKESNGATFSTIALIIYSSGWTVNVGTFAEWLKLFSEFYNRKKPTYKQNQIECNIEKTKRKYPFLDNIPTK